VSARLIPLNEVDKPLIEGWRQLGREALEPNPFSEADFVLSAARWLRSGERALAVIVESDGELRFLLPAIRIRHFRRIPVPALATWSHAYSFLGTPLLSPRNPEDVWGKLSPRCKSLPQGRCWNSSHPTGRSRPVWPLPRKDGDER
jgi:CelD/BcsL family acetyltransferase involved in cellulose biosynthesis